jgi:hypothetical protein
MICFTVSRTIYLRRLPYTTVTEVDFFLYVIVSLHFLKGFKFYRVFQAQQTLRNGCMKWEWKWNEGDATHKKLVAIRIYFVYKRPVI